VSKPYEHLALAILLVWFAVGLVALGFAARVLWYLLHLGWRWAEALGAWLSGLV